MHTKQPDSFSDLSWKAAVIYNCHLKAVTAEKFIIPYDKNSGQILSSTFKILPFGS